MSSFGSEHADKSKEGYDTEEPVLLWSELFPSEHFIVIEHSIGASVFIEDSVDHPDGGQVQDDQEHVRKPHPDGNFPEEVHPLEEPLGLSQCGRTSKNEVVDLVPLQSAYDLILWRLVTQAEPLVLLLDMLAQTLDEIESDCERNEWEK